IVLAGIVTIDPPIWPRLFALMPAAALLIGVLLADVSRLLETQLRPRSLAIVALLPALALMAGLNLYNAFVDYPDVTRQIAIAPTDVGNFLAHAPGANRTVMLSDGGYFLSYEPIQFLAPRAAGCTLLPNMPASSCPIYGSSRLFILLPGRVRELPQLQRQRPGGKVVTIVTYEFGTARVLAYELPSTPVSADRGSSPSPVHAVH
ncbi:MAG TPA: hypothetical protein VF221_19195, partial [Chloroflexota bacterium]